MSQFTWVNLKVYYRKPNNFTGVSVDSAMAKVEVMPDLVWDLGAQSWFDDLFPFGGDGVPSVTTVKSFLDYVLPFVACANLPLVFPRPSLKHSGVLVVDVIQVAYDIDNLEIRLWEHSPHVDYFLVVESTTTQRGAPKPMFFEYHRRRFADLANRIVYVRHEGHVAKESGAQKVKKDDWVNEDEPRQYAYKIVKKLSSRTEQKVVVLTGDLDEMWSREALDVLLANNAEKVGPETTCPQINAWFMNGAYTPPSHYVVNMQSGGIAVAFSLPQPEDGRKAPVHWCSGWSAGMGYHTGGFLSPYAWLAKELCLAEAGGISGTWLDPRERARDPYRIFNITKLGQRPCCKWDKQLRVRQAGDPIPRLLVERPERFPYLVGSADRCPHRVPAGDGWFDVDECTDARKFFGLCKQ